MGQGAAVAGVVGVGGGSAGRRRAVVGVRWCASVGRGRGGQTMLSEEAVTVVGREDIGKGQSSNQEERLEERLHSGHRGGRLRR
jgi:hypothetical protein